MMTALPTGWSLMIPELWVGVLALVLMALDLKWGGLQARRLGAIAALGLLPLLPILAWLSGLGTQEILGGMYRIDGLALFFKGIFIATAVLVLLMSREQTDILRKAQSEYYLLLLLALLGMLLAASSADFLMLFVSLELIAISFYVLTSFAKQSTLSLEAGMKYLILGSLASALLLYGIAFIYGATGTTQFLKIRAALASSPLLPAPLFLGLLLVLAGILFKSAAVPFHLWVPDVYQGAPTPTTAFLSVGSKAAGFLVALRVLLELFPRQAAQWSPLVAWIAGLTILYGNLGAIPQKNIKRLLGYSSVGHAGYLLIGIASGSLLGAAAVNFYLASYLVTNLAVFLVVSQFSRYANSDEICAYAGLSRRSPFLAAAMFLGLLSLAGVPPLSGFFGKFLLLLSAIWEGYLALAVVGAAAVVISLYYYLLIVKTMYVDKPEEASPIPVSLSVRAALWFCMAGMVGIGIWQGPFVGLASAAVKSMF